MVDRSVVESVQCYLNELVKQGIPVQHGVIFGSQVGTSANSWSDIDLMVVSPTFDAERKREAIGLLWRVAARVDSRIEPIAVGERQWEEDDSNPIIEVARREGEKVAIPEGVL